MNGRRFEETAGAFRQRSLYIMRRRRISSARPGRFLLPLLVSLTLAACIPVGTADVTRAIKVSDGAVVIIGPSGYCIDRAATRDGPEGAFVLFGTCAALANSRSAGQPDRPAVLTVSVLPGAPDAATFAESLSALATFFRSAPGRAALSRSGKADDVTVANIVPANGALLLELRDTSAVRGQQVEPDYWRGVLELEGRIVTVSALSLGSRPLTSGQKRQVLETLIARIRAANA